ncbi:MAG: alpha/beta hydrolase-fold protein, partial [bacterium]|nr:alpha/beta hydrolase-fold protein [bacterium]
MHLHLIVVVIPMIAFCSAAFAHTRADFEPRVRLIVEVPEQHAGGEVYLAGNLNDWNPGDPRYRLRPTREQTAREYFFELPLSAIPTGGLEFKFTKGSWETVERNADLQDISNRTLDRDSIPRPHEGTVSEIRLAVAAFADERAERSRPSTIVGRLETFEFTSNILGNARIVRVWLPEAYATETDRAFPVLYMHDGQNCFDEATSAFGDEWRIDETMTELIDSGDIEPMIVVGIDNSGAARAAEYNASYTSFRGIQPYGEKYIAMLVDELMPEIQSKYRVRTGPEYTSLGGSSFGGNITLLAAMKRPGV